MNKTLLSVFVCFAVLLCISFVSASLTAQDVSLSIQAGDTVTKSFTIENTYSHEITNLTCNITSSIPGINITFNCPTSIPDRDTKTAKVTISVEGNKSDGLYSTKINVSGFYESSYFEDTSSLKINVGSTYCSAGEVGDLRINDVNLNNNGRGDDNSWYLLDDIEASVEVENTGSDHLKDVIVEWCVYDIDTGDCTDLGDNSNSFNLNDGDTKTVKINFKVNPSDLNDFKDSYSFLVKAYSDYSGEDQQCTEDPTDIDLNLDDHFVVIDPDTVKFSPSGSADCGSNTEISAKIYNIGSDDENDVSVNLKIDSLGINENYNVGDINQGNYDTASFSVDIPKNATPGNYTLKFTVYDDNGDIFEDNDNNQAISYSNLQVEGNCIVPIKNISLLTQQTNSAFSGEDSIFSLILDNTGTEDATYTITISGYSSWASLANPTITGQVFSGETKTEPVTFNINKDASGSASFRVTVTFDGKTVTKDVSFNISKETPTSSGTFWFELKHNIGWAILIIVLIVVIIVLVALLSRKPRKVEQPVEKKNIKKKK